MAYGIWPKKGQEDIRAAFIDGYRQRAAIVPAPWNLMEAISIMTDKVWFWSGVALIVICTTIWAYQLVKWLAA